MATRVLFISAYWPESNATAAGIRLQQLIDLFKEDSCEVHYSSTADPEHDTRELLEQSGVKTHSVLINDDSFNHFIADLNPTYVVFDRYVIEEQFGWRVTETCPKALRILDTEDLHSLRVSRQLAQKENQLWTESYWKEQEICKREIASIYRCDLSIVISKVEWNYLKNLFHIPESLFVFLPFLHKANNQPLPSYEKRSDFVFIGNGMHAPNRDAVVFLKESIWPLIKKTIPKAKLHVYGAYIPQQIVDFHNPKEGFLVHGHAKSSFEVISQARVNLAPLRYGAGIKGKVVEGILYNTPTVVTDIAAEGIEGLRPTQTSAKDLADCAVKWHQDAAAWNAQCTAYQSIKTTFISTEKDILHFRERIQWISANLVAHRNENFIGEMLQYHALKSTKYFSKWIEEKNKKD